MNRIKRSGGDAVSIKSLLLTSLIVVLTGFHAADLHADPVPIEIGEGKLYPSIKISYENNDNVFATNDNMVEANAASVEPRLSFVADQGDNSLELGYAGRFFQSDQSTADSMDHSVFLRGRAVFTKRSQLRGSLSFDSNHLDFGRIVAVSDGAQLVEPIQYNDLSSDFRYRFGAARARGNFTLGLALRNRSYTNEPSRTDGLDFTRVTPLFIFSLRLTGDTRAFLDLRYDLNDYEPFTEPGNFGIAERDHSRIRAFVGTSWDITGRTSGSFKVGVADTSYDFRSDQDDQTVNFELDTFYAFTEFSTLEIGLAREQDDISTSQATQEVDQVSAVWNHEWSSRVSSRFGVERTSRFIEECGGGQLSRDRQRIAVGLSGEINIQLQRWLSFGLGFNRDDAESDICEGQRDEFERNRIDAHIVMTL